jgi:myosin-5
MVEQHKQSSVALPEFTALAEEKKRVDEKLNESLKKIADQDAQLDKLMADLTKQTDEIEARQKALNGHAPSQSTDESSTVGMLRAELASLREQLTRATSLSQPKGSIGAHPRDHPTSFNMALGKPHEQTNGGPSSSALNGTPGKRRNRRGSVPQIYPSDSTQSTLPAYEEYQPKAFSVANYNQDALRKLVNEEELDAELIASELIKLLEEEKPLDEDILSGIITNLRIPSPSSTTPPSAKEVLFPAHLISLVTNEMWKYGLLRESERFLANVMQTIQQHVMVSLHMSQLQCLLLTDISI